jgi:hypothetical protein
MERFSLEQRRQLLIAFQQSGLAPRDFARKNNIHPSTFSNWITRTPVSPQFVEILAPKPQPSQGPTARLCLKIGPQLQLECSHLPEPGWLAELARKLAC